MTRGGLLAAATRTTKLLLLVGLPLTINVAIHATAIGKGYAVNFGFDFHAVWQAGRDVLAGDSPYPAPHAAALAGEDQFVYPPFAALAAIPLSLLPFPVAASLLACVLAALVPVTLALLGVRDWRCYGIAFLWLPVIDGIRLGAISIVLAFLVALVWRFRDHPWAAALALAAAISAKVFLWPVLVWLLATRRFAAAIGGALLAALITVLAWTAIGFDGLRAYPRLLSALADLLQWKSYSASAVGAAAGLSPGNARLVALLFGALLLAAVPLVGFRRDGDRTAFVLALAAAFVLTPIVWIHYLVLLLVPVAVARPRLSPLWAAPLLMWFSPNQSDGELWRVVLGFLLVLLVLAASLRVPVGRHARARGGAALQPGLAET